MTIQSPPPVATAEAPAGPDGWMRPLMARRIEALGQMAEAGMDLVMAVRRRTLDAEDAEGERCDFEALGLAYARVSRAVRMTFALQHQAIRDLQAYDFSASRAVSPGLMAAALAGDDDPDDDPDDEGVTDESRRLNRVYRVVEQVVEAEHGQDTEASERLIGLAQERLEREGLYDDVLSRPTSEWVAEICETLGLEPDWSLLVDEDWARREIAGGQAGRPLAAWLAAGAGAFPMGPPLAPSARPPPERSAVPP